MYKNYKISPPFFEIGPKAYLYGENMLKLALHIDKVATEYDVDVILTPQPTDLYLLAQKTKRIHIYAQHMDFLPIGRGLGSILPEAVKATGAVGVMLNHAERKLSLDEIHKTIKRADEVGLATIVCADSCAEMREIAEMNPNIIVAEPTELIGTNETASSGYIQESVSIIKSVNPDILVLPAAGIRSGRDVANVISLGAEATGCTSGIIRAEDPFAMVEEMLSALRTAWDDRKKELTKK